MRFLCVLAFSGFVSLFAQTFTPEDPEVLRARLDVDRTRAMVETGALPRLQLTKAEETLADVRDAATIRHTIYAQDMTEEQSDELVAASSRRFERRKQAYDEAKKLVDMGIAPANSLDAKLQDMDFARKECELSTNRAQLAREIAAMAEAEANLPHSLPVEPLPEAAPVSRYDGAGVFTPIMLSKIETAYSVKFGKTLPISANGETAVHRSLGFDHSGRVDVAVHPDTAEGQWLLSYLVANKIPYFAFRQAVAGKATGAHIHIGPGSTHLAVVPAEPAAPLRVVAASSGNR